MRRAASLRDRTRIERFLRGDSSLHVFAIGDLDDFHWPYTTWYALEGIPIVYRGWTFQRINPIAASGNQTAIAKYK